jgi:hypothetical protein
MLTPGGLLPLPRQELQVIWSLVVGAQVKLKAFSKSSSSHKNRFQTTIY